MSLLVSCVLVFLLAQQMFANVDELLEEQEDIDIDISLSLIHI